jgi:hypothetical protein
MLEVGFDKYKINIGGVCENPECPNYALVQIPIERMEKNESSK